MNKLPNFQIVSGICLKSIYEFYSRLGHSQYYYISPLFHSEKYFQSTVSKLLSLILLSLQIVSKKILFQVANPLIEAESELLTFDLEIMDLSLVVYVKNNMSGVLCALPDPASCTLLGSKPLLFSGNGQSLMTRAEIWHSWWGGTHQLISDSDLSESW